MPSPSDPRSSPGTTRRSPTRPRSPTSPSTGTLPAALSGQLRAHRTEPDRPSIAPGDRRRLDGMVHAVDAPSAAAPSLPQPLDHHRRRRSTARRRARRRAAGTAARRRRHATSSRSRPPSSPSATGHSPTSSTTDLTHRRRVDLAGRGRGIGGHAAARPVHRALHLLASAPTATQPSRHRVARAAAPGPSPIHRRRPGPLRDLLVTRDHVVFLGDGFVGIADRPARRRPGLGGRRSTPVPHPSPPTTTDEGTVVVHTPAAPLDAVDAAIPAHRPSIATSSTPPRRTSVDHQRSTARHRLATCGPSPPDAANAASTATTCAPATASDPRVRARPPARRAHLRRRPRTAPAARTAAGSSGSSTTTPATEADLVVLDAAALDRPPVATVHIPRRIPNGAHGTWIPADHRKDHR